MKRASLAVLLTLAGCAGLPRAEREITVEAEGWASADRGDLVSAERRALADAQKKAIEKAIGVTVRARTKVDDAISVRQSIEANLGGTIRRYELLSAGVEDGLYKVAIRAVVLYRPKPLTTAARRGTRVSLNIANRGVEAAMRAVLVSDALWVVEPEKEAELRVTGAVETSGRADPRLGGFFSCTARVKLSIVDVKGGVVVDRELEASAVDTDEYSAWERALNQVGTAAGSALLEHYEASPAAKLQASKDD